MSPLDFHRQTLAFLTEPHGTAERNVAVERLDTITRNTTAFDTFLELLNTHPTYRPTIRTQDRSATQLELQDRRLLADAYDQTMERRGDTRRAYRGN